jgi:CRISPR-associated protein Csd1
LVTEELAGKKKLTSDEKKKAKELSKLDDVIALDFITGSIQPAASSHPKKISNASANSKLISDNDKTNFTFRGKFSESTEAVAIGYESSQKAHQFLRYLVNDRGRGYFCGEQIILSFAIGSTEKLLPLPIDDKSIWAILQESSIKTESDRQIDLRAETGIDYADALRKSLAGLGYSKTLEKHAKTAVIALDAATTGRLSITFYSELDRNEYLESIADWHTGCKWNQRFWSTEKQKFIPYAGAPSVDKIIEAVYGKPRGNTDESYTKIKKAARERLLCCIFSKAFLPVDYITAAVRRASNPLGVTINGKFDRKGFELLLSTACALVRKDYKQRNKEDYKLSIESDRTDRDYLYGRLLGAADKLEEYALYKKDKDRIVTAAVRHMQAFAQRPFRTWQTIHGCLNPYIQSVKGGFAFNEIQAVSQLFRPGDYGKEKDIPLDGSYLLGYYHERAHIDSLVKAASEKKKTTDNDEKENCNDKQ